jgi:hypothetical protein
MSRATNIIESITDIQGNVSQTTVGQGNDEQSGGNAPPVSPAPTTGPIPPTNPVAAVFKNSPINNHAANNVVHTDTMTPPVKTAFELGHQ